MLINKRFDFFFNFLIRFFAHSSQCFLIKNFPKFKLLEKQVSSQNNESSLPLISSSILEQKKGDILTEQEDPFENKKEEKNPPVEAPNIAAQIKPPKVNEEEQKYEFFRIF